LHHASREIGAAHRATWTQKSGEEALEQRTDPRVVRCTQAAIALGNCRGVDPHQNLLRADRGTVHLARGEDLGGSVLFVLDCAHGGFLSFPSRSPSPAARSSCTYEYVLNIAS